jgi:hypothetical protein
LVSALVAFKVKVSLQCTGWPPKGVMRTPMLVGTSKAKSQFFLNSICIENILSVWIASKGNTGMHLCL